MPHWVLKGFCECLLLPKVIVHGVWWWLPRHDCLLVVLPDSCNGPSLRQSRRHLSLRPSRERVDVRLKHQMRKMSCFVMPPGLSMMILAKFPSGLKPYVATDVVANHALDFHAQFPSQQPSEPQKRSPWRPEPPRIGGYSRGPPSQKHNFMAG